MIEKKTKKRRHWEFSKSMKRSNDTRPTNCAYKNRLRVRAAARRSARRRWHPQSITPDRGQSFIIFRFEAYREIIVGDMQSFPYCRKLCISPQYWGITLFFWATLITSSRSGMAIDGFAITSTKIIWKYSGFISLPTRSHKAIWTVYCLLLFSKKYFTWC